MASTVRTKLPDIVTADLQPLAKAKDYVVASRMTDTEPQATFEPLGRFEAVALARRLLDRGFAYVEINGMPVFPPVVKVRVTVDVDVNTLDWQTTYGLELEQILPDIHSHVRDTVRFGAKQAVDAIGAGARVVSDR